MTSYSIRTVINESRIVKGPLFKSQLLLTPILFFILQSGITGSYKRMTVLFFVNMFLYLLFAFMINDIADREIDEIAGKRRLFGRLSRSTAFFLILVTILGNIIIGYAVSLSIVYLFVLSIGLFICVAYSVKPFRLKERGIYAIIAAPILGKIIPILLVCILFEKTNWWILILILAESTKNALDILFHQIVDFESDMKAGVSTFVTTQGKETSVRILKMFSAWGTIMAIAMGSVFSYFVPRYRFIAVLVLMGYPVIAAIYKKKQRHKERTSIEAYLPISYQWFGLNVFLMSPFWLSGIIFLHDKDFGGVFIIIGLLTLSQVGFYFRYKYQ